MKLNLQQMNASIFLGSSIYFNSNYNMFSINHQLLLPVSLLTCQLPYNSKWDHQYPQQNKNNDEELHRIMHSLNETWAWTMIDAAVQEISVKQSFLKICNKDWRGRKTATLKLVRETKTCTYEKILKISPVKKTCIRF